jgi:TolA-binding protein
MATSIESIQKENTELRHIIAVHAGQIERNTQVIYQLLGGLFNQRNQVSILESHKNSLFGGDDDIDIKKGEINDNVIWPTTRQGDEHEARIKFLEDRLRQLEEQVDRMESRQWEKMD